MPKLLELVDSYTNKKFKDITTEEWFNNNKFAIDVYNKKYSINKETPPQTILRFCKYAAQAEETKELQEYWTERWFQDVVNDWWYPGGSIISGAGNSEYKTSLMNCTGVRFEEDTLKAIADLRYTVSRMAALRQGVGINFSTLRPKGFIVRNSSKESLGLTHWMKSFNHIGNEVGQSSGARIPALLFCASSDHPDVDDVVDLKAKSINDIRNANISILASDKFMKTAEEGKPFEVGFTSINETKTRIINPKETIHRLAQNMFANGEPGLQFIDTIKRMSNSDAVGFPIVASNACCFMEKNNFVATSKGLREINSLKNVENINVLTHKCYPENIDKFGNCGKKITFPLAHTSEHEIVPTTNLFYAGKQLCVKITFNNGVEHYVSTNHMYPISTTYNNYPYGPFKIVSANKLKKGMLLKPIIEEGCWRDSRPLDYEIGVLFALSTISKQRDNQFILRIGRKSKRLLSDVQEVLDKVDPNSKFVTTESTLELRSSKIHNLLTSLTQENWWETIPLYVMEGSRDCAIGYLRTLFSLRGFIKKRSKTSKKNWIENHTDNPLDRFEKMFFYWLQTHTDDFLLRLRILLTNFGIFPSKVSYPESTAICIRGGSMLRYMKHIGFLPNSPKTEEFNNIQATCYEEIRLAIKSIEELGEQDTWCLTQPKTNELIVNGVSTFNSEQMLDDHGVCLLGAMNMGRFSKENWEQELKDKSESLLRFLDDVNTMELRDKRYASEKQKISIESLRRVGCGVTNIVEFLWKCGVDYNTLEGIQTVDKFFERYGYWLYQHSQDLGQEKGNFLAFDREKYLQSPFTQKMVKDHNFQFTHMRNCALLCVAPVGSVSLLFRNLVSSYGAEPSFGSYYWKRTRVGGKWEFYFNVPAVIQKYMKSIGQSLNMEGAAILDNFAGTKGKPIKEIIDKYCHIQMTPMTDVSIEHKLEMLKTLASRVDASISVTNNLSTKHTVADVEAMIYKAWKMGIKSFTCYPENGNRLGIIETIPFKDKTLQLMGKNVPIGSADLNEEDMVELGLFSQQEAFINNATPRPKVLSARVHKTMIKGQQYYILVGFFDKMPYEIFLYKQNGGEPIPAACIFGTITKHTKGRYSYESDGFVIDNIAELGTGLEVLVSRFVSMALRHHIKIEYIIKQLRSSQESISDFSGGLARILRKYSASESLPDMVCPLCGAKTLVRVEGCTVCKTCSFQGACE